MDGQRGDKANLQPSKAQQQQSPVHGIEQRVSITSNYSVASHSPSSLRTSLGLLTPQPTPSLAGLLCFARLTTAPLCICSAPLPVHLLKSIFQQKQSCTDSKLWDLFKNKEFATNERRNKFILADVMLGNLQAEANTKIFFFQRIYVLLLLKDTQMKELPSEKYMQLPGWVHWDE